MEFKVRDFQKNIKEYNLKQREGLTYTVKDVLDRAGHKPKSEMKIEKTVHTYEQKLGNLIDETIPDVDYEVVDDE